MIDGDIKFYWVEEQPGFWRVTNDVGITLLECRDSNSAHLYADLLNKAYRAGYKAGYRTGRSDR
jgi:hypothetical protein